MWQSIPGDAEWEGFVISVTQTVYVFLRVQYAIIVMLSNNFELLQPGQCVQFLSDLIISVISLLRNADLEYAGRERISQIGGCHKLLDSLFHSYIYI